MRRSLWIILAVLVVGGALYAWSASDRSAGGAGQTATAQERMLMTVGRGSITRSLTYSGSLEPADDVTLTAGTSSWVTELLVSKGDVVAAGDVIARLDDADARLEVMRARREYDQARVESPPSVVEERRLALLSAERKLSAMTIVAPFAGVVADVMVREGDSVTAQTAVARLIDDSSYQVTLLVDQKDLAHVAVGQDVYVTPDAIPGLTLVGRVEEIDFLPSSTEGATTTYPVKVTLEVPRDEPGIAPLVSQLRPGLSVEAEIIIASAQDVLVVPISAIVESGREQLVTRVNANGVEETVAVETGLSDGLYVEIRSGLQEGDRIVINNFMLFESLQRGAGPGGGGAGGFRGPGPAGRALFGR